MCPLQIKIIFLIREWSWSYYFYYVLMIWMLNAHYTNCTQPCAQHNFKHFHTKQMKEDVRRTKKKRMRMYLRLNALANECLNRFEIQQIMNFTLMLTWIVTQWETSIRNRDRSFDNIIAQKLIGMRKVHKQNDSLLCTLFTCNHWYVCYCRRELFNNVGTGQLHSHYYIVYVVQVFSSKSQVHLQQLT